MPPQTRVPLSTADAAWLHMEDPTNLMMITGVFLFEEPVDFQRLRDTIRARLLAYERFRMRVVEPPQKLGVPHWELDPELDLEYHVSHERLPDPGTREQLHTYISRLMSEPLDRARPLWQLQLVENVDGGSALVARLHHSIADGIALMKVLLTLTDEQPDPLLKEERFGPPRFAEGRPHGLFWRIVLWLRDFFRLLRRPRRLARLAQERLVALATLVKLLLLPPDKLTVLKGELGVPKLAAVSEPLELDAVKSLSKEAGGTINDVLMAALTGGLRRYLMRRGQAVEGLDIRVVVPVDLRSSEDEELGNRFGLVFLSLPIGVEDPRARLAEVKRRMDALKRSPEAMVAFGVLSGLGLVPEDLEKKVIGLFGAKATAVVTNVPGPRKALYLAGKAIRSLMFWVPQSGHLGMGVSILSYAGDIRVGVATDAGLAPDPEQLVEDFHEAFDELVDAVQQERVSKV